MQSRARHKLLIIGLLGAALVSLAGCGESDSEAAAGSSAGTGGGSGSGTGGRTDGGSGGGQPPATVTISGTITYDAVPSIPGGGLDYGGTIALPVQGVTVEFVDGSAVLSSGKTDASGAYSLTVPSNRTGFLRAEARMQQAGAPAWDFSVVDNTNGDALYAMEGALFDTGISASSHDLHAASGWTGSGYTQPRAAAPFAILDTIRIGAEIVLTADPTMVFPPLELHWSPDNIPSAGASGWADPDTGEIVSTFYSPGDGGIFILGAENNDTDEYDRHVILHEFAHYLEHQLSRSDSIGGPHTLGDLLDMRVAFGEGWGNAFSGIASGDSVYRDSLGPRQSSAPGFDLEGPRFFEPQNPAPGWFSEQSVQEILYDLFDADADGADALSMSFSALYDVFTGGYRDALALTSIFPFVNALKRDNPAEAPLIDALLAAQSIESIVDDYGSTEINDGSTANGDTLPIYAELTVNGPSVNVCSTDEFRSGVSGLTNKLGTRRFLRFDLAVSGGTTLIATATDIPAGEFADPDLVLHRAGVVLVSEAPPGAACADTASSRWAPADCEERAAQFLTAGSYVLEVYEYTNTLSDDDVPGPIGRTCFDVEVTQP